MNRLALLLTLASTLALSSTSARADDANLNDLTLQQRAQVEQLRKQMADQIQLKAYDLLDELVYQWTQSPVFAVDTNVVLADVNVPVGFGSGLQALLENHFLGLVLKNPSTHVRPSHCPQCRAILVHSDAKGTVVSRGIDQPEALAQAGVATGGTHALFLDFEIEGAHLVLRARITGLEAGLPITYAKTLSSATSTAALLRSGEKLKSVAETRRDYEDALAGRGQVTVPVRFSLRAYAPPAEAAGIASLPSAWVQSGATLSLTQADAWTGELMAGVSYLPAVHTAGMVQTRFARLITGNASSLTYPDVYVFGGGALFIFDGPGALIFRDTVPTAQELLIAATGFGSTNSLFFSVQTGLEVKIKNRLSAAVYAETMPTLYAAPGIGDFFNLFGIRTQAVGFEVSLCF
jgi:hypothetical protein